MRSTRVFASRSSASYFAEALAVYERFHQALVSTYRPAQQELTAPRSAGGSVSIILIEIISRQFALVLEIMHTVGAQRHTGKWIIIVLRV